MMPLESKPRRPARSVACLMVVLCICASACSKTDSAPEVRNPATIDVSMHPKASPQHASRDDAVAARVREADPIELATAAWRNNDPVAARNLGGLLALCGGLELRKHRKAAGSPLPREWQPYDQACTKLAPTLQRSLAVEVRPFDHPDARRIAALEELAEDDPMREQGLAEVLRTSSIPEFRMDAAFNMLDGKRLREWGGDVLPSPNMDNTLALQMDASLLYGCRVGTDCSPGAFFTLGECAQTLTCTPGNSLERVIELRRSPLEMRIIRSVVDRLMQIGDT